MSIADLKPGDRFGLSRVESADYIGVSLPTFDWMVAQGTMPAPRRIKRRLVWIRPEVEEALRNLPTRHGETLASEAAGDDDRW